ncbi:MAG: toprim domain-containing protein [Candidatus Staskawiczbacteria bacterium]|nr:toprim domain-containing protein [Candidatus Staskawiczbacteria bacterium]
MELSCLFFENQLWHGNVGREAKEYLSKRGINEESIKKWRLGYSPDTWQGLSDFLVGKGYNREEIVKAGLAVEKEGKSDSYDRFRGRIIFPVFDLNSQVLGFGARVFNVKNEKEVAKYINTPQTLIYNKSNILYGLNNAKVSIRKSNRCVITEGYTDVIMCHQAGFDNVVASSGTALTSGHLDTLKRYSENLILAFDMDVAGDSATKRGIDLAQEKGFDIKVIQTYEIDQDPADIILKNPQNFEEYVLKARSIMNYYFDSAFASFDKNTPEGKKEISRVILPAVKRISNKIEQSHWIQKLSSMLQTREEAILAELAKTKINANFSYQLKDDKKNFLNNGGKSGSAKERKDLIEGRIISLLALHPENLDLIEEPHHGFFSGKNRKVIEDLKNPSDPEEKRAEKFKCLLADLELSEQENFEEDAKEEIKLCFLQLKNINIRERLSRLSGEIKTAEENNDLKTVSILTEEFNKITKEL